MKITWQWLGGFFDGEGYAGFQPANTVMYYRKRKDGTRTIKPYVSKGRIDVSIAQKDTTILKQIHKFLNYGHITGITWSCNSATARKFLIKLLPYLKTPMKKIQVIRTLKLDKKIIKPRRK